MERILRSIADGQIDMSYQDGMLAAADLLRQMNLYDAAHIIINQSVRMTEERRAAIDAGTMTPWDLYRAVLPVEAVK